MIAISSWTASTGWSQSPTTSHAENLAAWERITTVLQHPRCLNCHQLNFDGSWQGLRNRFLQFLPAPVIGQQLARLRAYCPAVELVLDTKRYGNGGLERAPLHRHRAEKGHLSAQVDNSLDVIDQKLARQLEGGALVEALLRPLTILAYAMRHQVAPSACRPPG
jgi:hypothetical protein